MKTIGVFDAKSHLSELIDSGEAITITKHGRPVALLKPIRQKLRPLRRAYGLPPACARLQAK